MPSDTAPPGFEQSRHEPDPPNPRSEASRTATPPRLDPVVFGATAALVIGVITWGFLSPESLKNTTNDALSWVTEDLGWLFLITVSGFVVFTLVLAASKYGKIPLGKDDDKPEFSTVSWIAMMFSAGMGIGLMFFGVSEPLTHFVQKPPGDQAPGVNTAMATTMFHWGFHPWATYAVVGLAIAYSTYRSGRGQLVSAVFTPLLGAKRTNGLGGKIIDILAIFATLFGTTASLGLGALQIGSGLDSVGWITEPGKLVLVAIIALLTLAFVASAVSGIAKGIQWLSNINMVMAFVLAVFVFVVGPTVLMLNLIPTTLGTYLNDFMAMSARSGASGAAGDEKWLATWTLFYWAWWVSWTPFVGLFLAKISRGRTIREFVIGVMVVPTSVSLVWFSIFGGTGISQQRDGGRIFESGDQNSALFTMLNHLPLATISSVLVMMLVAIFFISGADSASLVMGTLSQYGAEEPSKKVVVFWGLLTGGVAAMLLYRNADALSGLQTMTILAAVPFVVVMVGICLSLYLDLRKDPLIVARNQIASQVDDHVRDTAEILLQTPGNGIDLN